MGFQTKYDWDNIIQEFLKERELNKMLSLNSFTKEKEYSSTALKAALNKKGIVIESLKGVGGGVKIDDSLHRDMNLSIFDGILLGDGSIVHTHKVKNKYPSLSTSSKYVEYLEWMQKEYSLFSNRPTWSTDYQDKRTNKIYTGFWMKSTSSMFLLEQRKRWYPDGIKRLPYDVNFDNKTLLQFYLDDGALGSSGGLMISVDDFSFEEAETIIFKINNFTNLSLTIHNNQGNPRLYISKPQAKDFLSVIGDCPVPCFEYKWQPK